MGFFTPRISMAAQPLPLPEPPIVISPGIPGPPGPPGTPGAPGAGSPGTTVLAGPKGSLGYSQTTTTVLDFANETSTTVLPMSVPATIGSGRRIRATGMTQWKFNNRSVVGGIQLLLQLIEDSVRVGSVWVPEGGDPSTVTPQQFLDYPGLLQVIRFPTPGLHTYQLQALIIDFDGGLSDVTADLVAGDGLLAHPGPCWLLIEDIGTL